jgi:hypothetical protein
MRLLLIRTVAVCLIDIAVVLVVATFKVASQHEIQKLNRMAKPIRSKENFDTCAQDDRHPQTPDRMGVASFAFIVVLFFLFLFFKVIK